MKISDLKFLLECVEKKSSKGEVNIDVEEVKKSLMQYIVDNDMAPYWEVCIKQFGWKGYDNSALESMKARNVEKIKSFDATITDAVENLGENDVISGMLKKAEYLFQIGDKDGTIAAYLSAKAKALSSTQAIDIVFNIVRTCFFHLDRDLLKTYLLIANKLVEEGGDWDRRNRLKVYSATHFIMTNEISKAAALLLEGVATFTSYEMFDYNDFVFYASLTGLLSHDRVILKKKMIDSPEILAVIDEIPHIGSLVNSFYNCQYKQFFVSLVALYPRLLQDKYTSLFAQFLVRELRLAAYNQFLQSYKSCTITTMATTFGVSVGFLDNEISRFIAAGRLAAKIDKVDGIISTSRLDTSNAQYQAIIKQGDALLNKVQKLARVINV